MIGKRIQELRLAKGWSLTELAERAGVSKSYISYIEREVHTNPSLHVLEKISAVLNIDLNSLMQKEKDELATPSTLESDGMESEWMEWAREASHSSFSKEDFEEYKDFLLWRQINNIFMNRRLKRGHPQDLQK